MLLGFVARQNNLSFSICKHCRREGDEILAEIQSGTDKHPECYRCGQVIRKENFQ
jgi:hypothetical protein